MTDMDDFQRELAAIEQRVFEKLRAAIPQWPLPECALDDAPEPLPDIPDIPIEHQFPRPQWVIHPGRRAHCLVMAEWAVDHGLLWEAGFLLDFGGRERVA